MRVENVYMKEMSFHFMHIAYVTLSFPIYGFRVTHRALHFVTHLQGKNERKIS